MVICIMQHPSNIWSSIHEKVHKKGIAYKKSKNEKNKWLNLLGSKKQSQILLK